MHDTALTNGEGARGYVQMGCIILSMAKLIGIDPHHACNFPLGFKSCIIALNFSALSREERREYVIQNEKFIQHQKNIIFSYKEGIS